MGTFWHRTRRAPRTHISLRDDEPQFPYFVRRIAVTGRRLWPAVGMRVIPADQVRPPAALSLVCRNQRKRIDFERTRRVGGNIGTAMCCRDMFARCAKQQPAYLAFGRAGCFSEHLRLQRP
jgi:hypothetical protein